MSAAQRYTLPFADLMELAELQHEIVVNTHLILSVLEDQRPRSARPTDDFTISAMLREALQKIAVEIHRAAKRSRNTLDAAVKEGRRAKADTVKKGGTS